MNDASISNVDLHELAAWAEADAAFLEEPDLSADNANVVLEPPPASRTGSFDRGASSDSVLSTSSDGSQLVSDDGTQLCSEDEPDIMLDVLVHLDAFATRLHARRETKLAWTAEEDAIIAQGVGQVGTKWSHIRKMLPEASQGRTEDALRNRWQRLQRKQRQQRATAARGGEGDAFAPGCSGSKGGAPKISSSKYGDMWDRQEDERIESGVIRYGLLFRAIAAEMPGRTVSAVRNRWLRNQQKRLAARGIHVSGAPEVFAALRESGELSEDRVYRPLPVPMAPVVMAAEEQDGAAAADAWESMARDWICSQVGV